MKANLEHLTFLIECTKDFWTGYGKWNDWREANPDIIPQLCNVDFTEYKENYEAEDGIGYFRMPSFNFMGANFQNSNLEGIELADANLKKANLKFTNLENANLESTNLKGADFSNAKLKHVNFQKSTGDFSYKGADFGGGKGHQIIRVARMETWDNESWEVFRKEEGVIDLQGAFLVQSGQDKFYYHYDFSEVNLQDTIILNTRFSGCNFKNTNLSSADLRKCEIVGQDFTGANLSEAKLDFSILIESNFREANLSKASMSETNLTRTNFTGANLEDVNFNQSVMIETNFDKAILIGSKVYGISAWDLSLNETKQHGLNISKKDELGITVDDLEVAQFIYLLINNEKIRNVINTVTSKTVLILGRFYEDRKKVLDALRETLKEYDLAPIIFDFEPSKNRDLTETVQLLANMAKFVIADLTDAKSIPQELAHIIPFFPSVPVQPILLKSEGVYSMFEHWEKFDSVLPIFHYENQQHLLDNVITEIINPIDAWKTNKLEKIDAKQQLEAQQKKFEELKASDPEKYKELQAMGIIPY
jgi:uncharacterized protein YjbI with pentapeptide repeats